MDEYETIRLIDKEGLSQEQCSEFMQIVRTTLAGVLNALNANVLICGGIGGGAQAALHAAGIELYGGVSGNADKDMW